MSLKVYRGRTLARSQALQLLFQAEATDSPLERVLEGDFLISKAPSTPMRWSCAAVPTSISIASTVPCAPSPRTGSYAHARRRPQSAAYRRLRDALPYRRRGLGRIVINEAVELAKAYGTDQSASFVNGVLGRSLAARSCRVRTCTRSCWPRIALARRPRLPRLPLSCGCSG